MGNTINDYEHIMLNKLEKYKGCAGFPCLSDYGITEEEMGDYLFERQRIIDSDGDLKKIYTLYGILLLAPVIVMSAFANGVNALMEGLGIGAVLCLIYWGIKKVVNMVRLKRISTPDIDRFINDLLSSEEGFLRMQEADSQTDKE